MKNVIRQLCDKLKNIQITIFIYAFFAFMLTNTISVLILSINSITTNFSHIPQHSKTIVTLLFRNFNNFSYFYSVSLLISFSILVICAIVLGINTKFLIYLNDDAIYNHLQSYSKFELLDYFEKNNYISLSTSLTMYAFCYSIIFFALGFNKNALSLINNNNSKIEIILVIFVNSFINVLMYNYEFKRVKKVYYEHIIDK